MKILLLTCIIAVSLLLLPLVETMVSTGDLYLFSATARAYYGTGRRIARRTARRTARRVSRRHAYYRGSAPVVYGAPVAAAGTIAIGATVASLPPACQSVVVNGISYYYCGGTYYQAAYDGANLVYVVVAPPR